MASIHERRRSDGETVSYQVKFRVDKKAMSETFHDLEAAEDFKDLVERIGGAAAQRVRDARQNRNPDSSHRVPTVTEWVETHIEKRSGIEQGTKSDYRSYNRLSIAGTALGEMPVDVPTADEVGAWIDDLAETYSSKSIKNRHSLLSAAFAYAVKKGLRPDNPAKGLKIPESEGREAVFLTHGELALFVSHVDAYWKPLILAMAGTGLRWGEITCLEVRDLHLDDESPTLSVLRSWKWTDGHGWRKGPPKSKKGRRTIGLGDSVVRVFRSQIKGKGAHDLVFPNRQGRAVKHNTFHEMVWTKALKSATREVDRDGNKIPPDQRLTKHPTPHDLRHSHASWLIAQGIPLTEVQYRLGHESIKTTSDLYGHLMPGHLERSATAIEIAMSQALPELEESE